MILKKEPSMFGGYFSYDVNLWGLGSWGSQGSQGQPQTVTPRTQPSILGLRGLRI